MSELPIGAQLGHGSAGKFVRFPAFDYLVDIDNFDLTVFG